MFFLVSNAYAQSAIRLVIPINSSACFNGVDDDGDGLVDYPDDTDCIDQDDLSEHHLTATCSVSATTVTLGQPITWSVIPLGGSTTYTYSWSGSEIVANTQNVEVTYSSVGSKTASVTVTSGYDSLIVNCTDTVNVISPDPVPDTQPSSVGWPRGASRAPFLVPTVPLPLDIPPSIPEAETIVEEDTENIYDDSYYETRDPLSLDSAPERWLSTEPRASIDTPSLDTPDRKHDGDDTPVTQREDTSYPVYTESAESSIVILYSILFCLFLGCIFGYRKNILYFFKKSKR